MKTKNNEILFLYFLNNGSKIANVMFSFIIVRQISVFHERRRRAVDSFDVMILNLLRSNGRISNRKLAESVHLTASSVLKRVRALEKSGIIQGYTTRVNPMRLGLDLAVIIEVQTTEPQV